MRGRALPPLLPPLLSSARVGRQERWVSAFITICELKHNPLDHRDQILYYGLHTNEEFLLHTPEAIKRSTAQGI